MTHRKSRARDLGLPFPGETGPYNAITDISGVEVGYTTLIEGDLSEAAALEVGRGPVRTGVSAVLPRGKRDRLSPIWAGHYNLNGNGEMTGTHWIREAGYFTSPICITNTHSVGMAHHATVGWMIEQYKANFVDTHAWAMPVIAETYDGFTNDICGHHIKEEHVLHALNSSQSGPIAEGNVGGGTGMQTYEFKGGSGTASRVIDVVGENYTIGAFVQSNFGRRGELNILGEPVGLEMTEKAPLSDRLHRGEPAATPGSGSIIVLIGTDVPLLPTQLQRIAKRGPLGIGRTGSSGGHYSGDIILAFSTTNDIGLPRLYMDQQPRSYRLESINDHYMDTIYQAAVQAVEEAIINAMIAAETMTMIKPTGCTWDAIDHDRLCEVMKKSNCLR